jgi:hypothetical protein
MLTTEVAMEMEQFVREENLSRFQDLLLRVTDEGQRQQIKRLIAEEVAKSHPTGARRTIISLAASVIIGIGCIATISTDAFAYRAGVGRVGVGRAGVYHGGVYRGGVYRGAAVRRGVAVGVGAAAVGAAAYGAYGPYGAYRCGYAPEPPCR